MKQIHRMLFNPITLALSLTLCIGQMYGQRKTYSETFPVNADAVLEINTSHTDIQFETWNKNEVAVEAEVSLEGASDDDAERYFRNNPISILGNSNKVEIRTGPGTPWDFSGAFGSMEDFAIDLSSIEPLIVDIPEIPEIMAMPPMPPMPPIAVNPFDYDSYRKEGEAYLKEWQKEFAKGFDKEYQEELKAWSKKMEKNREEWQERQEAMAEANAQRVEKMAEAREKAREVQSEARRIQREARVLQRNMVTKVGDSTRVMWLSTDSLGPGPNIFYLNGDGGHKRFKVKKTIKIKMPKSMKMEMNVRHGEVKLAENTKNLRATLSYANLWATTIDGEATSITASYSPVNVQRWNYGQLQTAYSDHVAIREALNLRLSATSSEVTIDRLLESAFIENNFGPVHIKAIAGNFRDLDVTLQQGELVCLLPAGPYSIYINGTNSNIRYPDALQMDRTENLNSEILKGYHKEQVADHSIRIHSKFGEVVLE